MIPDTKHFVMVDDNADELFLAEAIFRQNGLAHRFTATRGAETLMGCLVALRGKGIAAGDIVVLLDIRMPRMNGFELIYTIRNDIHTHAVKIVMVSASRRHADHEDSSAIGADGFIMKPFSLDKLDAALQVPALL